MVEISRSTKTKTRKKRFHKSSLDQRFSNYIVFGILSTGCLVTFFLCYMLVLYCLWPLLHSNPEITTQDAENHHNSLHLPPSLRDAHIPGQEKFKAMAGAVKKRLRQAKRDRGITDENLLLQAAQEFDITRKVREIEKRKMMNKNEKKENVIDVDVIQQHDDGVVNVKRNGFIVLGMHRSGTSMLSGLLVSGCGYNVGKSSELIGANFDNEKGFFERVDVVLQNDQFMYNQQMAWSYNVINYDYEKALRAKENGEINFKNGKPGLAFLNDPKNNPWLQKDPRMCITLRTWLKLLDSEPAILFTYRHPLEVAKSLARREPGFTVERGLRLWIVYNMRAIQNSKGLCVVRSSNNKVLADPLGETKRISMELTSKCGLVEPPREITQDDVDKFVDPNLQHNKKKKGEEEEQRVLEQYNDGKCIVYEFKSDLEDGSPQKEYELRLYKAAMKIYCDFEAGIQPGDDYEWPDLQP